MGALHLYPFLAGLHIIFSPPLAGLHIIFSPPLAGLNIIFSPPLTGEGLGVGFGTMNQQVKRHAGKVTEQSSLIVDTRLQAV